MVGDRPLTQLRRGFRHPYPMGKPQQRVMIFSYIPGQIPADEALESARSQIERMIATNQQLAVNEGITSEETDAAIDEAMKHVRPRS